MNILIAYATTEGQTRKICRFCADTLMQAGHSVELLQVQGQEPIDPARYDAAILAASVHVGAYQKDMRRFARQHGAALSSRPALFLSVSLAAAGDDPDDHAELARIARDFFDETGFRPARVEQVAGAFRFTEYDFFRSWAMRWIAAQKGQQVDPHKNREYTDWDALHTALDGWLAQVGQK